MKKSTIDQIVQAVTHQFRSFGVGSHPASFNPIAIALKDKPPVFAAGVDVEAVVVMVIAAVEKAQRNAKRKKARKHHDECDTFILDNGFHDNH